MTRKKQICLSVFLAVVIIGAIWVCRPVSAEKNIVSIIIVSQNVSSGSIIEKEYLSVIEISEELATGDFCTDEEEAIGKIAAVDLHQGEILYKSRLTTKPSGISYALQDPDSRLMTIALSPDLANGFWLAAGNKVDIDLISRDPKTEDKIISLENIEIAAVITKQLSTTDYYYQKEISTPMISLSLNREQAKILAEGMVYRDVRLSVVCE